MRARSGSRAAGESACRVAPWIAIGLVAASATTTWADAPPAAAPPSARYGFPAVVRVLADGSRARFEFNGSLYALPVGSGVVDVAAQAREAYAAVARGMFAPPVGAAPLTVEVAIALADLAPGGGAGRAVVEHAVVVRDAAGSEIVRFSVRGDSAIAGYDEAAVSRAFARAAARAASAFEKDFDGSAAVGAWLAARGLARREPPRPVPPAVRPPRAPVVSYLDAGAEFGSGGARGIAARAGVSTERWLVAATFERITGATFRARPPFLGGGVLPADITATIVGIDGGALRRFAGDLELRAGLGARLVGGTGSLDYRLDPSGERRMSITKWALGGSLFAGLQTSTRPWTSLRLRARGGVEWRVYLGRSLQFDAYRTEVDPVGSLLLAYVGVELPVRTVR